MVPAFEALVADCRRELDQIHESVALLKAWLAGMGTTPESFAMAFAMLAQRREVVQRRLEALIMQPAPTENTSLV